MNKRVLRVIGLLAALALVFAIGAAAGVGIVFAANKVIGPEDMQEVVPNQVDPEPGVVIASVAPDGPAAEAGIKRGDILLEIDGKAVDSSLEITRYLFDLEPGDQVELTVLHGDEQRTLTATLGDRARHPYLGVTPCFGLPAEPATTMALGMAQPGALIVEVVEDSPAAEADLEVGDLIVAIDGKELDFEIGLADLIAEYAPEDTVTLEVLSPGEEVREVSVKLGEHPEKAGLAYLGVQFQPAPRIGQFEGGRVPFGGPYFEMPHFEGDFDFEFPEIDFEGGAMVMRVADDSPAAAAGLMQGDIIAAVDDEPVDDPKTVVDAVAERGPGDELKLTVYRPEEDETLEVEVTLAERPDPEGDGAAYLGVFMGGVFAPRGLDYELNPPAMRERGHRFQFEFPMDPDKLPFDFDSEVEPYRFHFEMPHDDCCGGEFSTEI
jgi:S1-C subfamily serine protease